MGEVNIPDSETTYSVISGYSTTSIKTKKGLLSESIMKKDGTSAQFLKADGSVDSNVYAIVWTGTQEAYDAISNKQTNTLYCTVD